MRDSLRVLFGRPHRVQLRPFARLAMIILGARWGIVGASLLLRPDDYDHAFYHSVFALLPERAWAIGFLLGLVAMAVALIQSWEPPFRLAVGVGAVVDAVWGLGLLGSGALDQLGYSGAVNWLSFAAIDLVLVGSAEIAVRVADDAADPRRD